MTDKHAKINVLISHPARIICVALPKCASSTLVEVFMRLAGFDPQPRRIRHMALELTRSGDLERAGTEFHQTDTAGATALLARYGEYHSFTVVREPAARLYSAYFNKLNRYTKAHRPFLYTLGKLTQILRGPKHWDRVETGNRMVQRFLSFPDFVTAMEQVGPSMDAHYAVQAELLNLPANRFDRVLDLRAMGQDLVPMLRDFGVDEDALARIVTMPQANKRAAPPSAQAWRTPDIDARLRTLYAADYAAFDFPHWKQT